MYKTICLDILQRIQAFKINERHFHVFSREILDILSSSVRHCVNRRRRRRILAINVDSLIVVRGAEQSLISMYERDIIITLYYRLTYAGGLHGNLVWGEGGWMLDGREEVEAGREKTPPNRMPIWLCVPCCIQTTIHGAPSYTLEYSHSTRSRGRRQEPWEEAERFARCSSSSFSSSFSSLPTLIERVKRKNEYGISDHWCLKFVAECIKNLTK